MSPPRYYPVNRAGVTPAGADRSSSPLRRVDDIDGPPANWPVTDPRVEGCLHGWSGEWGTPGERQHHCVSCGRWVWDHDWPGVTA